MRNQKMAGKRKLLFSAGDSISGIKVIEILEPTRVMEGGKFRNKYYAIFECQHCGKPYKAEITRVNIGLNTSCGCQRDKHQFNSDSKIIYKYGDIIGSYGVKFLYDLYTKNYNRYAMFECPYCHKEYKSIINIVKLGESKSCGCKTKEFIGIASTKHGYSRDPLYGVWNGEKQRCNNPNNKKYAIYGGDGIDVYDDWQQHPEHFIEFVLALPHARESGYSIDRKDGSKGYTPDNVRWATKSMQSANRKPQNGKKFVGVYKTRCNTFTARVVVKGINYYIGSYMTELEAAIGRDLYLIKHNLVELGYNLQVIEAPSMN